LIGNYGVPSFEEDELKLQKFFESTKIHANALIVGEYCENYSHWNAVKSLADWLKEFDVPGISGIDTRRLTKILREKGSMLGKVK
jgi:carbamoylphosphate synthase small subunit